MSSTSKASSHSFFKDVSKLTSGTAVAIGISLLITPFITRIYKPEDFGIAAMFISVSTILGIVSCLRYELAILLPKKDSEAANVLTLCLIIAVFSGITTAIGLLLTSWLTRSSSPFIQLPYLFLLLPIAVALYGINAALNRWNSRNRAYGSNSIALVSDVSTNSISQISFGTLASPTSAGLILSFLFGKITSALLLGIRSFKRNKGISPPNSRDIYSALIRYRKFPLVDSPSALINTASSHLAPLILGVFYSPAIAGLYALGYRLIQLPTTLVGSAIGQVFFQRIAEEPDHRQRSHLTLQTFEKLILLGFLPMSLLGVIGADLFSLIFGSAWHEAGVYTQILSIWGFFWFISSPLSNLFTVLERQGLQFIFNILNFSARLGSLAIGAYYNDARLGIMLFSISGAGTYLLLLIILFKLIQLPANLIVSTIVRATIQGAPIPIITFFLLQNGLNPIITISASALASIGFYLLQWKMLRPLK